MKKNMEEVDLNRAKILLVDDQPENLDVVIGILEPQGYDIRIGRSGLEALELVQRVVPDLILLDVMMPGLDGFETCRRLKTMPTINAIPVIFLTARTEAEAVIEGFEAGGVDYIAKPFKEQELRVRVATHIKLRLFMEALQEKNTALEAEIARRQALTVERDQLAGRLSLLSDEEAARWGIEGFIGQSATLKQILASVARLQQASTTSVLITGESGTGKELIARAIHFGSERATGPFVPVNCSAVPTELADSLFFGHVKGAFTGADRDKAGYFELADGGTLFLDEIGDMPLTLQAKLLRALEDGKVLAVGGSKERSVNVRVLSATNADLQTAIEQGQFRRDLFYRLASFPVEVPPLRQRQEDIPLLAHHFLALFAADMRRPQPTFSKAALQCLKNHPFPGNIRELKNVIERALIESGEVIEPAHLHLAPSPTAQPLSMPVFNADDLPLNMEQAEIALINRALRQTKGNVAQAARRLGINRMKVYRRLAAQEEGDA